MSFVFALLLPVSGFAHNGEDHSAKIPIDSPESLAPVDWMQLTLGDKKVWTAAKTGANSHLIFNLESLRQQDPQGWIQVLEQPSKYQIQVLVAVPYQAPSFEKIQIGVQEVDSITRRILNSMVMELEVLPVLEIRFWGDDKGHTLFDAPKKISLQPHSRPVILKFVNVRNTGSVHRIHGDGIIKHAPRDSYLSKIGDSYVTEVNSEEKVSGAYYCHEHDSGSEAQRINFNVENPEELIKMPQFPGPI
jgi:hypothetical protein